LTPKGNSKNTLHQENKQEDTEDDVAATVEEKTAKRKRKD
jgi:hypothetical protein